MASFPGINLTTLQLIRALEYRLLPDINPASIRASTTEKELTLLEEKSLNVLAGVRTRKNVFQSITGKLNLDCLARIFQLLSNEAKFDDIPSYHWLGISHVCRSWRNILLSSPSIWTLIDSSYPTIIPIFLKRSKAAALDVHIRHGCSIEIFREIMNHIGRFQSLSIELTSAEYTSLASTLNRITAPILRSLAVNIQDSRGAPTPRYPFFFAGELHGLDYLLLSHFPVTPTPYYLKHLTHIDLIGDYAGPAPSMTTFIEFLHANSNAKYICLDSTCPTRGERQPGRVLNLQNLRRLTMTNCAAGAILARLSLPRGAHLNVVAEVESESGWIEKVLPASLQGLRNIQEIEKVSLKLGDFEACIQGSGMCGSFRFDVKCPFDNWILRQAQAFLDTVKELWVENLHGASTSGTGYKSPILKAFFESAPQIQTLSLSSCERTHQYFKVLTPDPETPMLCPSLRNIVIYDDSKLCLPTLTRLAQTRKSCGVPLNQITITFYPDRALPVKDVMHLRQYVPTVLYLLDYEQPKIGLDWEAPETVIPDDTSYHRR